MIALIPARAGSIRVPGKNMRFLNGHPVIAYTIMAAQQSGVFENISICTDDPSVERVVEAIYPRTRIVWTNAIHAGEFLEPPIIRRPVSSNDEPDIAWVRHALSQYTWRPQSFAILRPTSPFRTADTIRRAYAEFQQMADCGDSIRAVEPCPINVYKCWTWAGAGMPIKPLIEGVYMPDLDTNVPLHSAPSQVAPKVWIQNSSLEMAHTANVEVHGSIAGRKIGPFFTRGAEGFSIDTEADWTEAVRLAREHPDWLPAVGVAALSPTPQAQ